IGAQGGPRVPASQSHVRHRRGVARDRRGVVEPRRGRLSARRRQMTRQTWYRIAIAILVLGEGYLVVSGRLAASYRFTSAAAAALMPSCFWFAAVPIPHTARTAVWLGLTGLLVGASVYCLERARPFLTPSWHEAQRGRLFRRWWSPYPISYDPPGNRWIVWH